MATERVYADLSSPFRRSFGEQCKGFSAPPEALIGSITAPLTPEGLVAAIKAPAECEQGWFSRAAASMATLMHGTPAFDVFIFTALTWNLSSSKSVTTRLARTKLGIDRALSAMTVGLVMFLATLPLLRGLFPSEHRTSEAARDVHLLCRILISSCTLRTRSDRAVRARIEDCLGLLIGVPHGERLTTLANCVASALTGTPVASVPGTGGTSVRGFSKAMTRMKKILGQVSGSEVPAPTDSPGRAWSLIRRIIQEAGEACVSACVSADDVDVVDEPDESEVEETDPYLDSVERLIREETPELAARCDERLPGSVHDVSMIAAHVEQGLWFSRRPKRAAVSDMIPVAFRAALERVAKAEEERVGTYTDQQRRRDAMGAMLVAMATTPRPPRHAILAQAARVLMGTDSLAAATRAVRAAVHARESGVRARVEHALSWPSVHEIMESVRSANA